MCSANFVEIGGVTECRGRAGDAFHFAEGDSFRSRCRLYHGKWKWDCAAKIMLVLGCFLPPAEGSTFSGLIRKKPLSWRGKVPVRRLGQPGPSGWYTLGICPDCR